MEKNLTEYIEKNKDWLIEKTIQITSKDTINEPPSGNENNGQEVIEKILSEMGLEIDRFSPDDIPSLKNKPFYLKGRDYTNRDNIVGFIGEGKGPTLIFNGHIDTIDSRVFEWTLSGALKPKLVDNRIYGMGACDMKGGIIASIFALKTIIDNDIPIKGKVMIQSAIDEEFGGANGSLACVEKGYTGDFAIIPEPTSMRVCVSHVGSKVFEAIVKGDTGLNYFGDKMERNNPIILASKLVLALKDYEAYLNSRKGKYEIYKHTKKPMNFMFSDFIAGDIGPAKILTNPQDCRLRFYLMNYPEVDEQEFNEMLLDFLKKYPEIHKNIEYGNIVFDYSYRFIEGGDMDLGNQKNKEFVDKILDLGKKFTGRELELSAAFGGTDFFAFNNYGNTPTIVFGPGGDNIHAANEYVELKDLIDLSKIFANLIHDYCCK